MRLLQLNELEREILYLVLMDAAAPVSQIAHTLGCRNHTVQSALRKFRQNDLISRRVMVNVFRLGFSRHAFYISLSSEGQQQRQAIVDFLVKLPCTSTVLEVGGEYDFFVTVVARGSAELSQFHRAVSARFKAPFTRKDVAITVTHRVFGEKSLVINQELFTECSYGATAQEMELDALDHRLLYALSSPRFVSFNLVARTLGIAQSTVDYRIKRLKERGVICGDMHEIRGELIGLDNYIMLVDMKGLPDNVQQRFYAFVKNHKHVAHLSYEVGHWDYMLGVAAERAQDVNDLVELLHKHFGGYLASVKYFPMFRARKVRDYPFGGDLPQRA